MTYNAANRIDRERAKRKLDDIFARGSIFDITERNKRRTSRQNNYIHLLFAYFAMETGYTSEWVKQEYFKKTCNNDIFRRDITGKLGYVTMWRSTADLDAAEMTTAIERFRNMASKQAGIYLPAANEHGFLQEIEIEAQRQKMYL